MKSVNKKIRTRGCENKTNHHSLTIISRHHGELARKIGEFFGKKGQETDIVFYSRLDDDDVYLIAIPVGYPDKLKSLLQALTISRTHVLIIKPDENMDALLGEMMISLASFIGTKRIIAIAGITPMNEYMVDDIVKRMNEMLSSISMQEKTGDIMVIRDMKKDMEKLKSEIMKNGIQDHDNQGPVKVLIDASFPVKGIGTVALGIVKRGSFQAGTMLELTDPVNKTRNVIIKSIQKHDVDCKAAFAGDRVGLAIKGIKADELSRDNMLVTKDTLVKALKVQISFTLNRFAKKTMNIADKQEYHVAIDHQVHPVTPISIKSTSEEGIMKPGEKANVTFSAKKAFWMDRDENWAVVTVLEKYQGRLRILGSGPATKAWE
ncbi:hypothetical protein GF325_08910 [Candidatus Bathyarchaeota archaeon]|nr:hypothetical protein [Candidatus Bathyarchaeota archaeon]